MSTATQTSKLTAQSSEAAVSVKDWIIVLTACLGAFMAVLDIQITNSSLNDIQGALGASIDEGSWISTAYLITEIIVIPLTDWLSTIFGFKQYFLASSIVFVVFSCFCATARDLNTMIAFRAVQGFSGGALIPLANTLILQRLPQSKQSIGLAVFALSATFAPAIGPSLGGYLTENFGWPFIFYLNIIPGVVQIIILTLMLEKTRPDLAQLRHGDYLGIVTMALGLGCLETFLEEGNRKDWFGSEMITACAIIAAVCLTIWLIVEFTSKRPFIDLRLFGKRNFFVTAIVNLALGACLYGPGYLLPVYLSQIHAYNALQIGVVMMWNGLPQLVIMPFIPLILKRIDARILIFFGLLLFALSFCISSDLSINFAGEQIEPSLIVRACGLPFIFVPLSGVAVEGIEEDRIGSASALYNMTRNLGGSFGIAAIGTLLTQREKFHSQLIGESVSLLSSATQERFDYLTQVLVSKGFEPGVAQHKAIAMIDNTIRRESNIMAFSDCFLLFATVATIGCLAVLF